MQKRPANPFGVGSLAAAAILSFSIWALSPAVTGRAEPWDASWHFYLLSAVAVGGVLGFFDPRHIVSIYVGTWLGQVIALAVLPGLDRSWFVLGIFSTAVGSILFVLGAAGGALLSKLVVRHHRKTSDR